MSKSMIFLGIILIAIIGVIAWFILWVIGYLVLGSFSGIEDFWYRLTALFTIDLKDIYFNGEDFVYFIVGSLCTFGATFFLSGLLVESLGWTKNKWNYRFCYLCGFFFAFLCSALISKFHTNDPEIIHVARVELIGLILLPVVFFAIYRGKPFWEEARKLSTSSYGDNDM